MEPIGLKLAAPRQAVGGVAFCGPSEPLCCGKSAVRQGALNRPGDSRPWNKPSLGTSIPLNCPRKGCVLFTKPLGVLIKLQGRSGRGEKSPKAASGGGGGRESIHVHEAACWWLWGTAC